MSDASVILHAAFPESLAAPGVAAVVRAPAEEIAEHEGVEPPSVEVHADRVELRGALPDPVLIAIAAQLRRATGRWHRAKYGAPLWQGDTGA